jgi:hypothetical protein
MLKNLVTPMVVMFAGVGLYAQSTAMSGTVTSSADNQPLSGVKIVVESPALLGARTLQTDSNGRFRVSLLPAGEYTVTYTLDGYLTVTQTVQLTAGETTNTGASLTPAQQGDR